MALQQRYQHDLPSCQICMGCRPVMLCMLNVQQHVCLCTQEATEAGALAISWKKKAHDAAQKVFY